MTIGVILAGGLGSRFEGEKPKQFVKIRDIPMLAYTISAFEKHEEIDRILIVCHQDWIDDLKELVEKYAFDKVRDFVMQGDTRRESSLKAISYLADICKDEDIVLIHDGARPNLSRKIISENIRLAREQGACQTVIPSQDTIVLSKDGGRDLGGLLEREKLFIVQTPQTFKYSIIKEAHSSYKEDYGEVTDDASLVFLRGGNVAFAKGDKLNIKLTTKEDLKILESLLHNFHGN